jgi:hypothetical protein
LNGGQSDYFSQFDFEWTKLTAFDKQLAFVAFEWW